MSLAHIDRDRSRVDQPERTARNLPVYRPIALPLLTSVSLLHSEIEHSKGRSPPFWCSLVSAAKIANKSNREKVEKSEAVTE